MILLANNLFLSWIRFQTWILNWTWIWSRTWVLNGSIIWLINWILHQVSVIFVNSFFNINWNITLPWWAISIACPTIEIACVEFYRVVNWLIYCFGDWSFNRNNSTTFNSTIIMFGSLIFTATWIWFLTRVLNISFVWMIEFSFCFY